MAHRLSKSRFQTGLQCPKALWYACHARELADPIGENQQHIFDTGTAVGELAQERFPGGVLVAEDYTQSTQALETTRSLLEDPPDVIYEAALQHEGVFVRPDILVRVGDGLWDLYEVKSSTRVKPENITDVAVQTWVLEGAGLKIRRAYLMHLNNKYVYEGRDYDLERLFVAADVTDAARDYVGEVPGQVARMLAMLDGPEPDMRIGKQCASPYTCSYHGHCHSFLPSQPVTALPRISAQVLDSLLEDGVHAIGDVPLDYAGLTRGQRDVIEVVRRGEPRYVGDLAQSLSALKHPVYFMDFETFSSALPLYPGTRPWQQLPFQWSVHVSRGEGRLEHFEYLHEGTDDPRPGFTASLLAALGDSGSVVVYSSFENTQLTALAEAFPQHADAIARVQERLFDLMVPVRSHVQHPDALGSSSIKAVLPALVPDLSYAGLGIGDGMTASFRYYQHATNRSSDEERSKIFEDLLAYCELDTLAMVKLLEVLQEKAARN